MTAQSNPIERPQGPTGIFSWVRRNLFKTPFDGLMTVIVGGVILSGLWSFLQWAINEARWSVITENFSTLMAGLYPTQESWRVALGLVLLTTLAGVSWGIWGRMFAVTAITLVVGVILFILLPAADAATLGGDGFGRYLGEEVIPLFRVLQTPVLVLIGSLFVGYWVGRGAKAVQFKVAARVTMTAWFILVPITFLLVRGLLPNATVLPFVSTNLWGGLLLTFMLAFVAITACFPLGILLAIGRASKGPTVGKLHPPDTWWLQPQWWVRLLYHWWRGLGYYPLIKLFSIGYIELFRGVPLVTVFFTANLVAGFALGDTQVDAVVRAMIALTLFEAAYIAEIVRGGLQSLPPGQAEAAKALGLNPILTMLFITLPQALRTVIPALVGQFITMFKDTSLVAIIGLLDLMGMANGVIAKPGFTERKREAFVFVAIVYFVFSYGMSYAARQLEKRGSGAARRG
ncbi:MAG: amino acid ABC transporter permease [Anaerolineae bacterium]|nr:amino acid ABC transporter permease [Anaerolineae bacterium]